ncbi:hypothetical protein AV521_12950 [Streptomyces sp. IMTB 2501]|uniref:helix-turn-helix transcriptional regulator n=1 Tax=Streptomyces sp. IMTB 2501 TaxID=1776340 RepID=UPI00096E3230|nr:response regulator transcription factor [Streptomyces sp. IMTB 2501]OLZ70907.1 hypothetical protein AV521_12950 [Streptomyces sp. IMTB 2501]
MTDPTAVCEELKRGLADLPHTRSGVLLAGRFAVETVTYPASDFSRFVRTEIIEQGHGLRLLLTRADTMELGGRSLRCLAGNGHAFVRVSSAPVPHLAFLGTELALVHAGARDGHPQILVARREATAALHQYQQVLWGHAAELAPAGRPARSPQMDQIQLGVLRMLGSGMKDDTAARQMNMSVRTYRRHVAAILKTLDVNTRFEAGLRSAELGLLSLN